MKTFDYRGFKCPIPVLKAFKIVKSLDKKQNQEISFLCDDKSAPKDFKDFCSNAGLDLISIEKKNNYFVIIIRISLVLKSD